MPEPSPRGPDDPYAHGYRDGFRDGWSGGRIELADIGSPGNRFLKDRLAPAGRAPGGDGQGADGKPGSAAADTAKNDDGRDGEESKDGDADKKDADKKDADSRGGDGDKNGDKKDDKPPLYKRPLVVGGVLLLLLLAIIAAIVFWRQSRHHEKTDDAFIDGHASAVAAQTGGRVTVLHVVDNQPVRAGDLLIEIDARDADARLAQARAQLADAEGQLATARAQVDVRRAAIGEAQASTRQSEAEFDKARQDLARFRGVDPDAVARQQTDTAATGVRSSRARVDAARSAEHSARVQVTAAETQVKTAEAGIAAARAAVDAANLQVSYGRVVAPIDGHVTRRTIEPGNVVAAGQPLMSIVSDQLWVTANYKETQLTKMQPGQSVDVVVDAFPDEHFKAHVDSIQRGTGAYFSMLPAENATGNYVKVVQRVPVKILIDDVDKLRRYPIGPGMSVTPNVDIP